MAVTSRPYGAAGAPAATRDAAPADGYAVNALTTDDLRDALRKGLADFQALPSHLIFIAAIYPIGAFFLAQLTYSLDVLPLFFPLVAGFAIVGPFVAIGLYEISRRREQGKAVAWSDVLEVKDRPGWGSIVTLGLLLFAIFALWLATAHWLYGVTMGDRPIDSVGSFLRAVLTTAEGWSLIIFGHALGFVFALAAFMLSAVSFPMLLDRPVGVGSAVQASAATIRRNPGTMAVWAAIIAVGLMLGSATLFVGLVLVLPILAHASWHLYRRAISWS
jgi:uncharacterized membrane protein